MRRLPVVLALGLAATVRAQWSPPPTPRLAAVEIPTSDAWTVVVGRIASFRNDGDYQTRPATLAVEETLKGPRARRVDARLERRSGDHMTWKADGDRLLVFIPWDPDAPSTVIDLSDRDLAVLTADLKLLRTPEAVLAAVRARLREAPDLRKAPRFELSLPVERFAGTPLVSDYEKKYNRRAQVAVPVDARLERYGREEVRSPEADRKAEGIRVLSLFPTDANVGLVEPFLRDEAAWRENAQWKDDRLVVDRTNPLRDEARRAMAAMGRYVDLTPWVNPDALVRAVDLDAGKVSEAGIAGLARYPNLEDLYLSGDRLAADEIAAIGRLASLRSLFLEGTNVADADLGALSGLTSLTYLGLGGTAVTDAALPALARLPALKRVDLGVGVTPKGLADLRRLRPNLIARPDEFAFLAPFHPRRIEVPYSVARTYFLSTFGREARFLRGFVLAFPPGTTGLEEALRREMPHRGWKEVNPGGTMYQRPSAPIAVRWGPQWRGDEARLTDLMPSGVALRPGERGLMVAENVAPD